MRVLLAILAVLVLPLSAQAARTAPAPVLTPFCSVCPLFYHVPLKVTGFDPTRSYMLRGLSDDGTLQVWQEFYVPYDNDEPASFNLNVYAYQPTVLHLTMWSRKSFRSGNWSQENVHVDITYQ